MITSTPTHPPVATATSTFQEIPYEEQFWTFYSLDDHFPPEINNQGNFIGSIVFSPEGIAWVSSSVGLWRYDKSGWRSFLEQDGMLSNSTNSVAVAPNGDVWVGSHVGVSKFDGDAWQTFPIQGINSLAISPNGSVWISHDVMNSDEERHRFVSLFDGTDWQIIVDESYGVIVGQIAVDMDGAIWISTNRDGIIKIDGEEIINFPLGTFENYYKSGGVCGLCVGAIEIAPDGTTWAMVANSGLVHLNGDVWVTYPYYTDGGPKTLAVSDEGNVWVGEVFGNVIALMENKQWYAFTDLPFNKVYDIQIAPDGSVWFGTGEGLYIYRD